MGTLLLDEMLARRRSIGERNDPETTLLVEDLSEKNRRLAQLLLRGAETEQCELHATRVEEARRETEAAERAVAAVATAREFFVVPEGQLHLVNVNALPNPDGGYLVETDLRVHLLSVERDLLAPDVRSKDRRGLLAMGALDFDADPRVVASLVPGAGAGSVAKSADVALFRNADAAACPDFAEVRFGRLGIAGDEIEAIESLWDDGGVSAWVGPAAGEGRFKHEAPGRGALHLATHAFFLNDACGAGDGSIEADRSLFTLPRIAAANPLLVSGLALAGANPRSELSIGEDIDDGMLTGKADPVATRFPVDVGHMPPLLLRVAKVEEMQRASSALGMFPDAVFVEQQIDPGTNDLLVAYSDGLTEAMNRAGEFFGEERLHGLVTDLAGLTAETAGARACDTAPWRSAIGSASH